MKTFTLIILSLLCFSLFSCSDCQSKTTTATKPTSPPVSLPTDGEQASGETTTENDETDPEQSAPPTIDAGESPEEKEESPQTPNAPSVPNTDEKDEPVEEPNQPEANEPNEDDKNEQPNDSTQTPSQPSPETPEENILNATEDTIEISANTKLLYRFQANRSGVLSIVSEYAACNLTVTKLTEDGKQTPIENPEEYQVQAGDVFLITVSNTSNKTLYWCIFLEP